MAKIIWTDGKNIFVNFQKSQNLRQTLQKVPTLPTERNKKAFKLASSEPSSTRQRPSPPVSWPRTRHRNNTMTSEATTEEDLEVDSAKILDLEDLEQIKIEAWLDENPEFFEEYLIRKGNKI